MIINTITGKSINLYEFNSEDIDINDIAISLSRQRRYAGHTSMPWNVAQHLILCSGIANTLGYDEKTIRACFLHDIEETWVQDIIYPVKKNFMVEDYEKICNQISNIIFEEFDALGHDKQKVKLVDELAYCFETFALRPNNLENEGFYSEEVKEKFIWLKDKIGFKIDIALLKMTEEEQANLIMEFLTVFKAEKLIGTTISSVIVDEPEGDSKLII